MKHWFPVELPSLIIHTGSVEYVFKNLKVQSRCLSLASLGKLSKSNVEIIVLLEMLRLLMIANHKMILFILILPMKSYL